MKISFPGAALCTLSALFAALMASPALADESATVVPAEATAQSLGKDVYGYWLTASRTGIVRIEDCGNGTPCGILAWIFAPNPEGPRDGNNPDPALQNRPVLGVEMLSGFRAGDDNWKKGQIYNPEDGKTYRSALKRKGENILEVKGCVGPVCKGQIWYRIDIATLQGMKDSQAAK